MSDYTVCSTAALNLITGTPGAGKTLRAVQFISMAIAEGQSVYVCNLNGLQLKGWMPFEDPTKWEDLPPGSLLVIDEAQKFFRDGNKIPEYVQAMETIRHKGVRLLFITQDPKYLHQHILGLIGRHEHLLRKHGGSKTYIFRSDQTIRTVSSLKASSDHDQETWSLPKQHYADYKSAEVHTVKFKIPSRWIKGGIILAIALTMAAFFFGGLIKQNILPYLGGPKGANEAKGPPGAEAADGGRSSVAKHFGENPPLTDAEFLARLIPRFPSMPWSAPVFDGQAVQAQPKLYCISSPDHCTCLTEQGTKYGIDRGQCRSLSINGPVYNPFLAVREPSVSASARETAPLGAVPPRAGVVDALGESSRSWDRGAAVGTGTAPAQVGPSDSAMSSVW